ncbi:hypothetical protein GTQ99_00950 [Kineococcus sp. T13]|uniref:hypothetical protein n=1 Tax=Kineococcus vitellinus TaxID=2696565 RepID=UPI0014125C95|nr:hypothetical protein [Kineococcus vitellinus]NAZ73999.1 hypothetical protein [Kineococcus vitellinus]
MAHSSLSRHLFVTRRPPARPRPHAVGVRPSSRAQRVAVAATAVLSALVAVGLTLLVARNPVYFGTAVRDVLAVATAGDPLVFYTGWVTQVGVFGWICAAAAGILAGSVARSSGRRREGNLLVLGGLVSAAMGVDDLMMFHDSALLRLGVPEQVTMGVLGLAALTWGLSYARDLLRGAPAVLLVLAALWFGHSLVADEVGGLLLHEEATKAAAICCWTAWFWMRSWAALTAAPETREP